MKDASWQLLATAPNVPAAHAVVTLLEGSGVPCKLKAESSLLGEGRPCGILVEASRLHRAKAVMAEASFTDAELEFLATGHRSCDDAREES